MSHQKQSRVEKTRFEAQAEVDLDADPLTVWKKVGKRPDIFDLLMRGHSKRAVKQVACARPIL